MAKIRNAIRDACPRARKRRLCPDARCSARVRMLTTGFSQQAERQIYIWDRRAMEEPKEAIVLDQGSASKCATSD